MKNYLQIGRGGRDSRDRVSRDGGPISERLQRDLGESGIELCKALGARRFLRFNCVLQD